MKIFIKCILISSAFLSCQPPEPSMNHNKESIQVYQEEIINDSAVHVINANGFTFKIPYNWEKIANIQIDQEILAIKMKNCEEVKLCPNIVHTRYQNEADVNINEMFNLWLEEATKSNYGLTTIDYKINNDQDSLVHSYLVHSDSFVFRGVVYLRKNSQNNNVDVFTFTLPIKSSDFPDGVDAFVNNFIRSIKFH